MPGSAEREAPDMRAHRLASEMATRLKWQRALGTPSFYNIAREVMIEEFALQQTNGEA